MTTINVNLRPNQLKKALSGATFQLDKTQLDSRGYELEITHKPTLTRYNKALRNNTGIRFASNTYELPQDEVEGGRIRFKKIGKRIRNRAAAAGNAVANRVNQEANRRAAQAKAEANRQIALAKAEAKRQANILLQNAKRQGKEALKEASTQIINKGLTGLAGMAGTAASGNPAVGVLAGAAAGQANTLLTDKINREIDGLGFKSSAKKLVKGSPEARAFMANLRNRKNTVVKQIKGGAVRKATDRPVGGSSFGQYQLERPEILRIRSKNTKPVVSAGSFLPY